MPYKDEEKRKQSCREYCKTMKYKIYDWKRKGIKLINDEETYVKYMCLENCELCDKVLTTGNKAVNRKCLDHDHLSGYERSVCCNECNAYKKKTDNFRMIICLEIHREFQKK